MKKKIVKSSLKLNKKTISNINQINAGALPRSRRCELSETDPVTIEAVCFLESIDKLYCL